jgi:PP-loop superfamily ATP-utilizing enzyme
MIVPAIFSGPLALVSSGIGRAAAIALAIVLAIGAYTLAVAHFARQGVADRVQTRIVTKIQREQGRETIRRETVLQKVQVRSQRDIATIQRQAARIEQLVQESNRASIANDADACLDPAAVLRIAAVR